MKEKNHISLTNIAICIIFMLSIYLLSKYTNYLLNGNDNYLLNVVLSTVIYTAYSIFFYNVLKKNYSVKKLDYFAILGVSNWLTYTITFIFAISIYDIDVYQYMHMFLSTIVFSVTIYAIIHHTRKAGKIEIGIYIVIDVIFAICTGIYFLYIILFHLSVDTLYPGNNIGNILLRILIISLPYAIFYIISYVYMRLVKKTGLLFWLAQGVLIWGLLCEMRNCLYGTLYTQIENAIDKVCTISEKFIMCIPLIYLFCIVGKKLKITQKNYSKRAEE